MGTCGEPYADALTGPGALPMWEEAGAAVDGNYMVFASTRFNTMERWMLGKSPLPAKAFISF
jgi:hypothetical protein